MGGQFPHSAQRLRSRTVNWIKTMIVDLHQFDGVQSVKMRENSPPWAAAGVVHEEIR